MIYACDFDGTLCFAPWPSCGSPNMELFNFLIEARKRGDKVILWSCRIGEALNDAVEYCKSMGLEFDAVNDNLPELITYYGNNPRKISADIYVDDKSVQTNDFIRLYCKRRDTVRSIRVRGKRHEIGEKG